MLRSIVKPKVSHLLKKALAVSTTSSNGVALAEHEPEQSFKSSEPDCKFDALCRASRPSYDQAGLFKPSYDQYYNMTGEDLGCDDCLCYQSKIKDLTLEIKKLEESIETLKASYSSLEKMYEECKNQLKDFD